MAMDKLVAQELLLECDVLLKEIGLSYFLAYGTALGAYRDNGFTPTEVDIDLGFLTEEFIPNVPQLANALILAEYEIHTLVKPFNRCWAIKARKCDIGIDLVSFTKWTDQVHGDNLRFCVSTLAEFSGVYQYPMLEEHETVEVFGRSFYVPSPIEHYLELEYGPDWKTPRLDHVQRTRVMEFRRSRGVPASLLDKFDYEDSARR